jgi:putative membrane protein (TIGR04086 family)
VTRRIDLRAIAFGAGIALAVAVPASLLAQALDDADRVDDDGPVVFVAAAVIIAALVVGGAVAAARQPAAPLRHGALAALAAFIVVAAIALIRRTANDDDPGWLSLGINAVVAVWAGLVGALASEARLTWRSRGGRAR